MIRRAELGRYLLQMARVGRFIAAYNYHHVHLFGKLKRSRLALGGGEADRIVGMDLAAMLKEAAYHVSHKFLEPLGILRRLAEQRDTPHFRGRRATCGKRRFDFFDVLDADSPARAKLADLKLTEQDIADAVAWARPTPSKRKK